MEKSLRHFNIILLHVKVKIKVNLCLHTVKRVGG